MIEQKETNSFESPKALIETCIARGGTFYGHFPAVEDRRVLLASHELGLTGAPIVLLYLAQTLKRLGWHPVLISPAAGPLLDSLQQESIPVLICPLLLENDVLPRAAGLFRFVILNTAVFAQVVTLLNGLETNVLWWIHEAREIYRGINMQSMPTRLHPNITVYADSTRSLVHLLRHRPGYFAGILPFGIPDRAQEDIKPFPLAQASKDKHIFALVGTVERRKGQDILLDAVGFLPEEVQQQCFFVFVGPVFHAEIGERIHTAAYVQPDRFQYIPQIPIEELPAFYTAVECVVCASRDDPGPNTVVESCQFSKSIICSEHTGIATFIEEEHAGFVYGNDDPEALARCIVQLLDMSRENVAAMHERARALYLSHFSPMSFDQRVEKEILLEMQRSSAMNKKSDTEGLLLCLAEDSIQRIQQLERTQKQELGRMTELTLSQEKTIWEKQIHIEHLEKSIGLQQVQIQCLEEEAHYFREAFNIISNATSWKMTKPIRFILDVLKWTVRQRTKKGLLSKGLYSLAYNGLHITWQKTLHEIYFGGKDSQMTRQQLFSEEELAKQRLYQFPQKIKFSIVVPLYNTPESFLREMIESVLAQTYADWELCMADGSDNKRDEVERICKKYAKKDNRIHYLKLQRNLGISGNTNACLEMAGGDYIGFLDHDDLLHPAALYEVMRAIHAKNADFIYTDETTLYDVTENPTHPRFRPHFKPDFAPDNLRANNYICHFTVVKRALLDQVGFFDPACDGSQDHDMILRLTEKADCIVHIPEILYYWRSHAGSVAESIGAKPYVIESGIRAVKNHLERIGLEGDVEPVKPGLTIYRIRYAIKGCPKVSILIPNYEHLSELKNCLNSIFEKTTWSNYEIVIVENNSHSSELFSYYDRVQREHENLRVVKWEGHFNYSAINNYGVQFCKGEYLLLLNNDTEIISPDWIQEMLMFSQRSDVGAVGAKLYYPDNRIQHAGVGLGLGLGLGTGGIAGHFYFGFPSDHAGYQGFLLYPHNLTAVTGACMMLRRDVWDKVGGLDEEWAVDFNDVDLCMRIRQAGYLIIWTPFAELYHYESKSRGKADTPEKQRRFNEEVLRFQIRWAKELENGDPYFNPNFVRDREDFTISPTVKQYDAR